MPKTNRASREAEVTIYFGQDREGNPTLRYEADSHKLGSAVVEAIASVAGYVATRVRK